MTRLPAWSWTSALANVIWLDAVVVPPTCASHDPAVFPTAIVVPAASPVGTVVVSVIAVVPAVTADELIVPAAASPVTPDRQYRAEFTPISSTALPPGGTGN